MSHDGTTCKHDHNGIGADDQLVATMASQTLPLGAVDWPGLQPSWASPHCAPTHKLVSIDI
eukprot:351652-Chlamydomonas_euryale.AAC.9